MKVLAILCAGLCIVGCSDEIGEPVPTMILPTEIIDLGVD
jgi:hypothetical protein